MELITAQIIGATALIISSLAPQQNKKNKVLVYKLFSNALYALQYLILGAFSAVVTNIIGVIREYIFYRYAKANKDVPISILYIYILIVLVSGIFTFNGFISILPILLSILTTYSVWQNNLKKYRGITVIIIILWMIYNFAVNAFTNAIGNVISLISAIIAIIRLDIMKNEEKK